MPICSVRVVGTGDAKPIKRHIVRAPADAAWNWQRPHVNEYKF